MIKINNYSKEELELMILDSNSYSEFIEKIGYSKSGNVYKQTQKYLESIGINYKFSKKTWSSKPIEFDKVFILNSNFNSKSLKIKIIKYDLIPYICVKCNNTGEWMGSKISLQLDHINGNNKDNRLCNLRFLCPNCHSQTDTYSGKNLKNKYVPIDYAG